MQMLLKTFMDVKQEKHGMWMLHNANIVEMDFILHLAKVQYQDV